MYLRAYRTSDLPALYLLDKVCFEPPFRFSRETMRRFAEAENAIVRLACEAKAESEAEQVVGFCIVHLERAGSQLTGYVVTLDVDPGHRRQGIGPALMNAVEVLAGDAGAQEMALHVWTGNDPAMRLYRTLGYAHLRTATDFYGPGLDALVYRKPLGPAGPRPEGGSSKSTAFNGTSRAS